jgi:hypothetical protein
VLLCAGLRAEAQTPAAATATDVYHVSFSKAALGQAAALGDSLRTPDPKAAQPGHVLVLRHQHGDDWDYAVVEHLGPKATVEITPPGTVASLRSWHDDTFVAGPSWAEFAKAMGMGEKGGVYVLSAWRAAPGQREALEKALRQTAPGSKVPTGNVVLAHVEGGAWQYLGLTRYNSWSDFAADQPAAGSASDGWTDVRKYGSFHRDTIADRLPTK